MQSAKLRVAFPALCTDKADASRLATFVLKVAHIDGFFTDVSDGRDDRVLGDDRSVSIELREALKVRSSARCQILL